MKKINKRIIKEQILHVGKRAKFQQPYTWLEIQEVLKNNQIELQPNDVLEVGFKEGWDEGDSACDDSYDIIVTRERIETDKEFEERLKRIEKNIEEHEKFQYEQYLKLKTKFEGKGDYPAKRIIVEGID